MVPLIALAGTLGASLLITALRGPNWRPNLVLSLRIAVGAMFLVTGLSHFVGMREQIFRCFRTAWPRRN